MQVEQRAGEFRIEYYTDGYPHWIKIYHEGEDILHGLRISDIHDLHYACERIIAGFPEGGK